jgi:hypothetical protein
MLTRGMSSLLEALEEGRTHTHRVTKIASASTGGRWTDWAFASGQPGYDTRIGPALEFAPESGVGNASVYTGTPEECCLLSATLRADGAGGPVSVLLFDLVGVYSLVDGDSSEFQPFTHEEPLLRYESGKGVLPLLVSSVAPALSAGLAELNYVDAAGVLRVSDPFAVAAHSIPGQVVQGTAAGASFGGLRLPGVSGVRSVAGIRYLTPPGGLQSVYLIRPVAQLTCNGNPFLATERFFHPAPVLPAGCALHLLFYQQTASATSFFGQFTFAC